MSRFDPFPLIIERVSVVQHISQVVSVQKNSNSKSVVEIPRR